MYRTPLGREGPLPSEVAPSPWAGNRGVSGEEDLRHLEAILRTSLFLGVLIAMPSLSSAQDAHSLAPGMAHGAVVLTEPGQGAFGATLLNSADGFVSPMTVIRPRPFQLLARTDAASDVPLGPPKI